MADNMNRPVDTATSPGQGNPLLPNNSDNDNLTNRSGSMREGVADAASRTADMVTGNDINRGGTMGDLSSQSGVVGGTGMYADSGVGTGAGAGVGSSYSRYYSPNEGRQHLSGLFNTRAEAENAVDQLERLGVPRSDISVLLRNENETAEFAASTGTEVGSKAGEGAGAGSAIGGTVGAILGALAATATSIAIPGVGILIAGPIAGALAGAGAGGLTGGLLGALVGAGIPEETARTYESGLNAGGVVVVADVPASVASQARSILNMHSSDYVANSVV